eukprot:15510356-Heterocapsa_arctica.AAC.1
MDGALIFAEGTAAVETTGGYAEAAPDSDTPSLPPASPTGTSSSSAAGPPWEAQHHPVQEGWPTH